MAKIVSIKSQVENKNIMCCLPLKRSNRKREQYRKQGVY